MKLTSEQLAELKSRVDVDLGFGDGLIIKHLIADLEEAKQIIRQEREVSIGTDDLLKGRISFLESALATTRKQLEEAQAKLADAEKDAARYKNLIPTIGIELFSAGFLLAAGYRNKPVPTEHELLKQAKIAVSTAIDSAFDVQEWK